MRAFVISLLLAAVCVLQSTILSHIELFGVMPNIMLVVVVSFAVLRLDVEGAVIGLFAGLLIDSLFGRVVGLNAILYMSIGFFCGKPFRDFYRENYLLPLFLVIGMTFFYEFCYYITNFLFRSKLDVFYYARKIIIPEMCYNAFLTIPVYRLVYGVNSFLEKREEKRRRLF